MKRILVTGFSGFVGRHFLNELLAEETDCQVLGIDIRPPQFPLPEEGGVRASFMACNLLDAKALEEILADFRPDAVLHLAAFSSVAYSWEHPSESFQNNTGIFLNLCEGIRRLGFACRILSVGSSEVYGEVRCDYLNVEGGWWCIDTWKTADDNEEGEVVGWVDAVSGNIYYKHETAMCSQKVREVATAKQAEVRKEKAHEQGLIGETIAMLTAQVWGEVYKQMREPDCTQLSCAIRDAAYRFETKWNDTPSEQREGYYIDMIDEFAKELIKEFKTMYC